MGLFDKFFGSDKPQVHYKPVNEQEAIISILYACIKADGHISQVEEDKLFRMLVFKTYFVQNQIPEYLRSAAHAHHRMGSKETIESCVSYISTDKKALVFTMAIELIIADSDISENEKEIAEFLSNKLELEKSMSEKIIEVMLIRNQGNYKLVDS